MSTGFCERCYKRHMEGIRKMTKNNPNVIVDPRTIDFRCKIPMYTHDARGRAVVRLRDCETGNFKVYLDSEYRHLQQTGQI